MRNLRFLGLGLAAFLLFGTPCHAQDSLNVTKVGEIEFWDDAYDVAIAGDYAYMAVGYSGLRILDVSSPTSPIEVGSCGVGGQARSIAVSGDYAYVTLSSGAPRGLQVLNISNPSSPIAIGWISTVGYAMSVALRDSLALIADYFYGLIIIDISNPATPVMISSCELGNVYSEAVAVEGNYAYVAVAGAPAPWTGLRVIDISDPLFPIEVGMCYAPDVPSDVAVQGDFAYLADGEWGIRVISVIDPQNPTEVGICDTPDFAKAIICSGALAFVSDWSAGLRIIDIANPEDPFEIGYCDTPGEAFGADVSQDYAYISDGNGGLRIIDISNSANPAEIGRYQKPGMADDVEISGNIAYLAGGADGLVITDISNPTDPVILAFSDTPGTVEAVAVDSNYAYVVGAGCGLRVIDISSPANPAEVGAIPSLSYGKITIANGFAYLYNLSNAIEDIAIMVNIMAPANPVVAGVLMDPYYYWISGIDACGDLLYMTGQTFGLSIYDISNAPAVSLISHTDLSTTGPIDAVEGLCYIASQSGGLVIMDVSDPLHPLLAGSVGGLGGSWDIYILGSYAFVADYDLSLGIINVSDPANGFLVGYYASGSQGHAVQVAGNYAYVGEHLYFRIYDCSAALPVNPWETTPSQPSSFAFHPAHPNPFNPTTVASYELRVASHVQLRVYDTAGRLVTTLVDGWKSAGKHQITFDGSGLPSGIYLARLTAGDFQQAQKLVLLK